MHMAALTVRHKPLFTPELGIEYVQRVANADRHRGAIGVFPFEVHVRIGQGELYVVSICGRCAAILVATSAYCHSDVFGFRIYNGFDNVVVAVGVDNVLLVE
jgi:hypothetical protein